MTLNHLGHPLRATVQEHLTPHAAIHATVRPAPFVTISRQGGVSGRTLAHLLISRLNELDPGPNPWTFWDRQLVEIVAQEHHLTVQEVQALEDSGRSWLVELLGNVSLSDKDPFHDEFVVYRRVAHTIRKLAHKGRVAIVGRGGAYITHGIPGGVHLRLVAPLDYRIKSTAQAVGIAPAQAEALVRELDNNREAFCRRYFQKDALAPESFTATFNAAALSLKQMMACTLPMLGFDESAPATAGMTDASAHSNAS